MLIRLASFAAAAVAVAAPPRVDYKTYLGGSYTDNVAGLAAGASGSAYIAGNTSSPDFPLTSTAFGAPSATRPCAFITKLNSNSTAIDFSICIAGSRAVAFAMDFAGAMYVLVNRADGYAVLKLDASATKLLYTAPVDGGPEAIAVDKSGAVYIAGSASAGLHTTPGVFQPVLAAGNCPSKYGDQAPCPDAFVTKLDPAGAVVYTTYLGGNGPDNAHAVGVDGGGNVWVAGETVSTNFPATPGALQSSFHGEVDLGPLRYGDAFVAKLDPAGATLLYSTYLGGAAPDAANTVAVDASGSAYVGGGTQSPDFPTSAGAALTAYRPPSNQIPAAFGAGFVSKFDSSGRLVYSTFVYAIDASNVYGYAVHAIALSTAGQLYVSAAAPSSGVTLRTCPNRVGPSTFLLDGRGAAITASSDIGGSYLATDSQGLVYTADLTYTVTFFTTPYSFQTRYGGGDSDAFAAKLDFSQPADPAINCIGNAASRSWWSANSIDAAIAPGELVSIFGSGFASQPSVDFDGVAAPVLYSSDTQINAVAPFSLRQPIVFASVQSGGRQIGPIRLNGVDTSPAIFTADGTGAGQAAAINQDGTINSAANPAPRGSVLSLYMTGAGRMAPDVQDGSTGPLTPPFPTPLRGINVGVGGKQARVTFIGQAPGLIAGVVQVNIEIPADAPVGPSVTLAASVGSYFVQNATAIAVR